MTFLKQRWFCLIGPSIWTKLNCFVQMIRSFPLSRSTQCLTGVLKPPVLSVGIGSQLSLSVNRQHGICDGWFDCVRSTCFSTYACPWSGKHIKISCWIRCPFSKSRTFEANNDCKRLWADQPRTPTWIHNWREAGTVTICFITIECGSKSGNAVSIFQ